VARARAAHARGLLWRTGPSRRRLDTGARRASAGAGTLAFAGGPCRRAGHRRPGTRPSSAPGGCRAGGADRRVPALPRTTSRPRAIQWLTAMAVLARPSGWRAWPCTSWPVRPISVGLAGRGLVLIPIGQAFAAVPSASRVAHRVVGPRGRGAHRPGRRGVPRGRRRSRPQPTARRDVLLASPRPPSWCRCCPAGAASPGRSPTALVARRALADEVVAARRSDESRRAME